MKYISMKMLPNGRMPVAPITTSGFVYLTHKKSKTLESRTVPHRRQDARSPLLNEERMINSAPERQDAPFERRVPHRRQDARFSLLIGSTVPLSPRTLGARYMTRWRIQVSSYL
jgi:hypothetical protein